MTNFGLKLIAVLSMLVDHVTVAFDLSFVGRGIGRIAFPLFAYCIAEGCRQSRNVKMYILRLGVFGLISEIPFQFLFYGSFSLGVHNVYFTLTLGSCAAFCYQEIRKRGRSTFIACFPAALCAGVAVVCETDYGGWGVLLIFAAFVLPSKKSRIIGMAVVLFGIYMADLLLTLRFEQWPEESRMIGLMLFYYTCALGALPVIALYTGRQGPRFRWAFYGFYPVHLLMLWLLTSFLVR